MRAERSRFPIQPVRDIEAKVVQQTGCPGMVAIVTVDFEPLSQRGYEFEVASGLRVSGLGGFDAVSLAFLTALDDGIRGELAEDEHNVDAAVRVLLREVKVHPVDSSEHAFRAAGRKAVHLALRRSAGRE
jgi:translation elongation factor EF-G